MKRLMFAVAILLTATVHAGELKLELAGKGMAGNEVRIAIYNANAPEQFPSDQSFYRGLVSETKEDRLTVIVPDLPPGKYAVAAYVDDNRNGRQDTNFLGMPKEIYGFSNNARGMFGPPDFTAAAFEIGENIVTVSIHLH